MVELTERNAGDKGHWWRIVRWSTMLGLLLLPAVMMQFNDDWNWTIMDFLVAGVVIGICTLLYEFAERISAHRTYRAGAAMAILASFLTIWSTLVRDDGNGIGFLLLVLAAATSSYAAHFRAAGMARAMLGVAIMEALLGIAIATAPSTASLPFGPDRYLAYCGVFAFMWLVSAGCFRWAAKEEQRQ